MIDDDSYQRFDPSPLGYRSDEEKARAAFRAFVTRSKRLAGPPDQTGPVGSTELIDSPSLDDDHGDSRDQGGS